MSRRQLWLMAGLFGIVVVLTLVFWITWQSIERGQAMTWSYSELFDEAQKGQVVSVSIRGESATAINRHGQRYLVMLSPDPSADARALTADGVNVTFEPQAGGAYWLQVLVPNLILLLLFGGGVFWIAWSQRRRSR